MSNDMHIRVEHSWGAMSKCKNIKIMVHTITMDFCAPIFNSQTASKLFVVMLLRLPKSTHPCTNRLKRLTQSFLLSLRLSASVRALNSFTYMSDDDIDKLGMYALARC